MSAFDLDQCSSGCESGWTLYLNHSASSHGDRDRDTRLFYDQQKDKRASSSVGEEEDLSMVSDASSGPPHFPDDDDDAEDNGCCFYSSPPKSVVKKLPKSTKKQKVKENKHLPSFLHDTATSPLFDFSTNNVAGSNQKTYTGSMVDYSQGFSATYFEGKSSFQEEHFGFIQPSLSENELQGKRWYGGKGVGMR